MKRRGRRRDLLVAGITALALAPVAVLGLAAPVPSASAAPVPTQTLAAPGAGPDGTCAAAGLVVAGVIDGATLCSTGPEPGEGPVPPGAAPTEATAGIQCYGDGTSGARVQLVYAHPSGVNRLSALRATMRTRAAQMETIFNASAGQTGGQRHIRWVTDANCNLEILDVVIPVSQVPATAFSALMSTMVSKGFSDPDRKYVIWAETNNANPTTCSGLGTLWYDAQPTSLNWNDTRTGYARLDETCLRSGFDGRTEAHELMHTIGGVQPTAPNATPSGHCRDEGDRMCYDDDGAGPVRMRSVCSSGNELRFDCGHDDYFAVNAACGAGGWLASRWNTADSRWLESVPGGSLAPPVNDRVAAATPLSGYAGSVATSNAGATQELGEKSPAGKPGGRSIWFSWTAPVTGPMAFDTCGSDTDTLLGVFTGSTTSLAALVSRGEGDDDGQLGQQSRVTFGATAGTTYLVQVDGRGGDQGPVTVRWGAPSHGYPDVPLGAWYEASVNWVKRFALLDPQPGGGFGPKVAMTRSQVVTMLWRLADRPAARSQAAFGDVPVTAAYRSALNWAAQEGIVAPYPDGTFHPNATVKRGHFADMLWRLAGSPSAGALAGFGDVAASSKLAPAVGWAAAESLVTPYPDGTFRPKKALTRQQIAAILFDFASSEDAWAAYPATLPSTVVFRH